MSAVCLQIFVNEAHRHQGRLTYEWLLDQAQAVGIQGGSAFQSIAGFGRHGRHDAGFFELAGELPVAVQCIAQAGEIDALLKAVSEAGLKLAYARLPAEFGITG
jgi:PII-like signaling protein